jgi:two-component system, OmpR family, sensor histidine kinase TctE
VLEVEDTGPGVAPAERDAVFRPFYRALGTQVDGSGLGLAIVQQVAQRHGAVVSISDAKPRLSSLANAALSAQVKASTDHPNAAAPGLPGTLLRVQFETSAPRATPPLVK